MVDGWNSDWAVAILAGTDCHLVSDKGARNRMSSLALEDILRSC